LFLLDVSDLVVTFVCCVLVVVELVTVMEIVTELEIGRVVEIFVCYVLVFVLDLHELKMLVQLKMLQKQILVKRVDSDSTHLITFKKKTENLNGLRRFSWFFWYHF
jgi:hypothetical protein